MKYFILLACAILGLSDTQAKFQYGKCHYQGSYYFITPQEMIGEWYVVA